MSDPDVGGDAGSADTSTTTTTTPDGKLMTQSQIDGIVGRAENKAAKEARSALLEELGMDVGDAKKAIAEAQAAAEARLTNEQRLERKLAEAEAERERERSNAQRALAEARITAALAPHMDLRAIRRIAPTIHVDPDATDDDIAAIVEDLREEVPGLFSTPPPGTPPPGTTSQNRQRPASRRTAQTDQEEVSQWVEGWLGKEGGGAELPIL